MYYGYYSNSTLNRVCNTNGSSPCGWEEGLSYSMPLAYFFTIGTAFFITCIILVFRYEREYCKVP